MARMACTLPRLYNWNCTLTGEKTTLGLLRGSQVQAVVLPNVISKFNVPDLIVEDTAAWSLLVDHRGLDRKWPCCSLLLDILTLTKYATTTGIENWSLDFYFFICLWKENKINLPLLQSISDLDNFCTHMATIGGNTIHMRGLLIMASADKLLTFIECHLNTTEYRWMDIK